MKKVFIVALFALSVPQIALGWGRIGHRTIAEIAERNLTPKAKANIERYTKGTPLFEYSLWVDEMRNHPDYKEALDGFHASIVDSDCTSPQIVRDRYRNGKDGVTAMNKFREQLKNYKELPDSVVMFALKSMIHIVGDFNCPSHMRYVDNENKGNFAVKFLGKESYMHKVWDSGVIGKYHKDWKHIEYADHLNTLSKKEIKKITKGWAQQWLESGARNVRPATFWVNDLTIENLDQPFLEKAGPLVEEQIQRAGYQLAKALNTIFK